jgi:transcriptional regulator with XRE-family HTH domain
MKTDSQNLAAIVGTRLRERRRSLGILQEDLAGLAGISVHTLSNLESGKGNPSLEVLERLLDCLGLQMTIGPRAQSSAAPAVPANPEHP